MPVQRHLVVVPQEDNGVGLYPLKTWLREHRSEMPPELDPDSLTSHQLRGRLLRLGWTMQETPEEVRLIKPGSQGAVIDALEHEDNQQEDDELNDHSFSLEAHLRDFLVENLESLSINGKRLRLYVSPDGKKGVEYTTGVGRIDILAVDDEGAFYVFELKLATSPDYAVGQVARYMGWLMRNMAGSKQVFGVIVARKIDEKLRYAISVVPKVFLFEYAVKFQLSPAHEVNAPISG
jgi:endonuclease